MTSLHHRITRRAAVVAIAAAGVLLPASVASAYPVGDGKDAATGYAGYTSDGSGIPKSWQSPGDADAPATTSDAPTYPTEVVVTSAHKSYAHVDKRYTRGYVGFVNGDIPSTWTAPQGGPATTDVAPPAPAEPPAVKAAPDVAPSVAPDVVTTIVDDGAPVLPWILATIVFALLAAGLAGWGLLRRRQAPARVTARV